MTLKPKQVDAVTRERQAIQGEIRKKFGSGALAKAYERLCGTCADVEICLLLPITLEGKDCPYWRKKEVKKRCRKKKTS